MATYTVAMRCVLGRDRRIRLPRPLGIVLPFYVLEIGATTKAVTQATGQLVICERRTIASLRKEVGAVRVWSRHETYRPALPVAVCQKFSLVPGDGVWLLGVGTHVEVWSEALMAEAMDQAVMELARSLGEVGK